MSLWLRLVKEWKRSVADILARNSEIIYQWLDSRWNDTTNGLIMETGIDLMNESYAF